MGTSFPPLGDTSGGLAGYKVPPTPVDPGVFMGGGKARALGTIDTALKAVQAMKTQQYNQGYANAERQYQIADANFQTLWKAHTGDPTDPNINAALQKAEADRMAPYDALMNYPGKGTKGGKGGQDIPQPQTMAQKIGTYLRNVLTGPPQRVNQYPISTPPWNPTASSAVKPALQPLPMQFAGANVPTAAQYPGVRQGLPQVGDQATVDGQPVIIRGISPDGRSVDVEPMGTSGQQALYGNYNPNP